LEGNFRNGPASDERWIRRADERVAEVTELFDCNREGASSGLVGEATSSWGMADLSKGGHLPRSSWLWPLVTLLVLGIVEITVAAVLVQMMADGRVIYSFEKGSSPWTQVPWQPIVTAATAVGALITFVFNQAQKQRHFDRQQGAEQSRFELQALDNQFADTLDRLASEQPFMRANAAIRLAEMAAMRQPGRPCVRTAVNYPFFERALWQLVAALRLERDGSVRHEVVRALSRMNGFCRDGGETLREALFREVRAANVRARDDFAVGLGRYCQNYQGGFDAALQALAPRVQFCESAEATVQCLRDLLAAKWSAWKYPAGGEISVAGGAPKQDWGSACVEEAAVLTSTVEALASLLSGYPVPSNVLEEPIPQRTSEQTIPSLTECFLAGASLSNSNLKDVLMMGSYLHGVRMSFVSLDGAHLEGVHLNHAKIGLCRFAGAFMGHARLDDAELQAVWLTDASLAGATLLGTRFLEDVYLNGTKLGRAEVDGQADGMRKCADFGGANWWDADFDVHDACTEERTGERDEQTQGWLEEHFPRPAAHLGAMEEPRLDEEMDSCLGGVNDVRTSKGQGGFLLRK